MRKAQPKKIRTAQPIKDVGRRLTTALSISPNLVLVFRGLFGLGIALVGGTLALMHFEGMRPFDAFYFVIITIATVGYGEVKPEGLGTAGRIIAIVIIFYGITFVAYTSGTLVKIIVEGEVRKLMGRRKLEKRIAGLRGHYIVCGFGRIGQVVCRELQDRGVDFVVVENNPGITAKLDETGYVYMLGDGTDDAVLHDAGVEHAKGLVSALSSDAENVYITLTARGLNPELYVVASASDDAAERKVEKAGANQVISPYTISGLQIAQALLKPTVVEFIEYATLGRSVDMQIEEHRVDAESRIVGQSLKDIGMRESFNLLPVAVKRAGDRMVFNPPLDLIIEPGDILLTMGAVDNLQAFSKLAGRRSVFA